MIREFSESLGDAIFETIGRTVGRVQENTRLQADLLESDDAYLVVFDTPGANASELQVRYIDDRIEVQLDRFRSFYDDYELRFPGRGLTLDGSITLPEDGDIDPEAASATLKQTGALHVRVPKTDR
jgi:HSP20 family molecular chaperone IbpA